MRLDTHFCFWYSCPHVYANARAPLESAARSQTAKDLSGEDVPKLEALRDAERLDNSDERVALDALIDAIVRCGTIRVWAEY